MPDVRVKVGFIFIIQLLINKPEGNGRKTEVIKKLAVVIRLRVIHLSDIVPRGC